MTNYPGDRADIDSIRTVQNDPNSPKIIPFFSDKVLAVADEVFQYMTGEFYGGKWQHTFAEFSDAEKAAFFISLSDAFGDETNA